MKFFAAYRQTGNERWWNVFNGVFTVALAGNGSWAGTAALVGLALLSWLALASAHDLYEIDGSDHVLNCMPLFHVGGLSILTRSAIYMTEAVVHEGFDVNAILAAVREVDGVRDASLRSTPAGAHSSATAAR